jgi:hypothetical protein
VGRYELVGGLEKLGIFGTADDGELGVADGFPVNAPRPNPGLCAFDNTRDFRS